MHINQVEITNFHGIEYAVLDLHKHTTVLLGSNAVGKSAILDALAILSASYFLGIDGVNSLSIKKSDVRQERVLSNDGSLSVVYHLPCILSAKGSLEGRDVPWGRELFSIDGNTRKGNAPVLELAAQEINKSVSEGQARTRPFLGYYSAARLGLQKRQTSNQNKRLRDINSGYLDALDREGSNWRSLAWFSGLQGRASAGMAQAPAIFQEVKNRLLTLFKGVERPLSDIFYEAESQKILVLFKDEESFTPIEFLSSGYTSVLSVGLDIIYRIFSLNPHLSTLAFDETPGIALIDELDMHLHPKWQGRIVDDLRDAFPSLQFIVATHSPFVVQGVRDCNVVDLDHGHVRLIDDYIKMSISEVAEDFMNMESVERSPYFMEQVKAAEEYFTLLKTTSKENKEKLKEAKERLDQYEFRYNRDPAFIGLLRAERNASGLDKE